MENLKFEPSILIKLYKLYLQTHYCLKKFPKRDRYSLGGKIENTLLDLIEFVSVANIQIKTMREPILYRASGKCELLKLLLRLSFDLSLLNEKEYIELEEKTLEIGKMLGGWIKYYRNQ